MTDNSSKDLKMNSNLLKEELFPSLTSVKIKNDWSVFYYNEFADTLIDENANLHTSIESKLEKLIDANFSDYRFQLNCMGASLLVAIFYKEKEIRFYSPKLNQELFLIKEFEALECEEVSNINSLLALKEHTQKVASLSTKDFPSVYDVVTQTNNLPNLLNDELYVELEKDSQVIIKELLIHLNDYKASLFEKFSDYGLGLTAQYALLRIHLLKFLAILPSLDYDTSGTEVKRVLLEAIRRMVKDSKKAKILKKRGQERALPEFHVIAFRIGYVLFKIFPARPLANFVRFGVRMMAKRFIAGESIELAEDSLKQLYATNRDVTLDQLGELVVSEKEADHYCDEVIKLVRGFSLHVNKGDKNACGINKAHVSIKVSALCSDFKPYAPDYTYEHVAPRLKKILLAAKEEDVFINIDAEHYDYRDIVFKVYKKVLLETPELKDYAATGIVLQAYLRDGAKHLEEIVELAKERGMTMPVRLVKGAYWDAETVEADAHSLNAPEFLNKEETDLHFRQLIVKMFEASPHIQLCLASHNFSDHSFAEALRNKKFSSIPLIEHQCLHMTYEALSTAMAKMGWTVRNYVPVGSLIVGMAYLVRRIMENSSQVGVLTIMRSHKKQQSMVTPYQVHSDKKSQGELDLDKTVTEMTTDFFNVAPVRTYLDEERHWVESSLIEFKKSLGKEYANSFIATGEKINVPCSSKPELSVGEITFFDKESTVKAIETLDESYNQGDWANAPYAYRASMLVKAANLMTARRNELTGLIVYESGKAVNEALADVDEAIDFLNFYAREESRIHKHNNKVVSRGPTAVISPWNFPLAIPCGMAVSSLVAGNTVALKSAEQTPLIAQVLVDLLHEAGIPKDVLIHTPGLGESVGDTLVKDERIASIVFTGSKDVGMLISHNAGKRIYKNKVTGLEHPVKVITEMGGKNAVIVTANAELDETVAGILYSAFGHSGQKCSACSRVFVDNTVKNRLIERLKEACLDIEVGEAFNFSSSLNPVITLEDKNRLIRQVKEASDEAIQFGGKVHVDRSAEDLPGFCVGPTLIELPKSRALKKDSFAMRELFGPVVHVIGFDDIDEAIEMYNGTDYALTGGVFSQSQDDIDYLTSKLESGNIYVNRSVTGARVAIEPFGGFKLSGTGPKAGGKSYLASFHVNPVVNPISVLSEEKGSEYQFDLSSPSKLSAQLRVARVEAATEDFVNQFESLFSDLTGADKEVLKTFKKWLSNNAVDFFTKERMNRVIPGQLSYNDMSISEKYTLVVSYTEKADFMTFMKFIAAVTSGTGVTVLCRNEKSYGWWNGVAQTLFKHKISTENLEVYFANDELVMKSIKNEDVRNIIVDGDSSSVESVLNKCFDGNKDEKRMKNVLSVYDCADKKDFKRLCETFVCVRAFAVNTMRHGAPMDLDL